MTPDADAGDASGVSELSDDADEVTLPCSTAARCVLSDDVLLERVLAAGSHGDDGSIVLVAELLAAWLMGLLVDAAGMPVCSSAALSSAAISFSPSAPPSPTAAAARVLYAPWDCVRSSGESPCSMDSGSLGNDSGGSRKASRRCTDAAASWSPAACCSRAGSPIHGCSLPSFFLLPEIPLPDF